MTQTSTAPEQSCVCGGAGWYKEAVPFGHPNFNRLLPCVCKLAEQEERRQAEAAARLAEMHNQLGTFAGKTFENFDLAWDPNTKNHEKLQRALYTCRQFARDPGDRWLFLTSKNTGTGKSHLAAAVANTIAAIGRAAYYASALQLINAIRAGFQKGDYDKRLDALCNVSLLVLDDLGSEGQSESNRGLIFHVINHRAMRPELTTIISSNAGLVPALDPPEHIPNLDPRVASRIRQYAQVVTLDVNDYRAWEGAFKTRLAS